MAKRTGGASHRSQRREGGSYHFRLLRILHHFDTKGLWATPEKIDQVRQKDREKIATRATRSAERKG